MGATNTDNMTSRIRRRRAVNYKTDICKFFQQGRCDRGERCAFAHSADELRERTDSSHTNLCRRPPDRGCKESESNSVDELQGTRFAHSVQEHRRASEEAASAARLGSRAEGPHAKCLTVPHGTQRLAFIDDSGSSSSTSLDTGPTDVPGSEHTNSDPSSASQKDPLSHSSTSAPVKKQPLEKTTTLLVTGVPVFLTQGALLAMFEDLMHTMRGACDFFHCPWDDALSRNLGYAIINFPSDQDATAFTGRWANHDLCPGQTVRVVPASRQGLQPNIDHFLRVRRSAEQRFWPLFRDRTGMLQPLARKIDSRAPRSLLRTNPNASTACLAE